MKSDKYVLGTGRGVVEVEMDDFQKVYENIWYGYDFYFPSTQAWELKTDPNFPNGVFIHSHYYPNRVLEVEGAKFLSFLFFIFYLLFYYFHIY